MIKIENTEILGWKTFVRKMENFRLSSNKSDSWYGCTKGDYGHTEYDYCKKYCTADCRYYLGIKDLKLIKSLNTDNSDKLLKMINVFCDITAPLYWWYKFGYYKPNEALKKYNLINMIEKDEFTIDNFSSECLYDEAYDCLTGIIMILNEFRRRYLNYKDKNDFFQIQQLLPVSYNVKLTINLTYYDLKNIYFSNSISGREEWIEFKKWIETLPYFKEICLEE